MLSSVASKSIAQIAKAVARYGPDGPVLLGTFLCVIFAVAAGINFYGAAIFAAALYSIYSLNQRLHERHLRLTGETELEKEAIALAKYREQTRAKLTAARAARQNRERSESKHEVRRDQ